MEKKTIGSFISVLRRAHGMTQKELGEKLFVSDKTVSRWERDECAPDLSLIPVIADLFGVTTDELLRGERKNGETDESRETGSQKSERQYRYLLQKRMTGFKNLILISCAVASLGPVAALICNLGFTQAKLGFGLGLVFLIAGAVTLFCSFQHDYLHEDAEDRRDDALRFNTQMIECTKNAVYLLLAIGGVLLPLLFCPAYMGLTAEAWLLYGGIAALALLLVASFLYEFFLKIRWMEKGLLIWDDTVCAQRNLRLGLLKRIGAVGLTVAAVLLLGFAVSRSISSYSIQRPMVFEDFEEFRNFAEKQNIDYYYENGNEVLVYEEILQGGDSFVKIPTDEIIPDESDLCEVRNHKGELIYTYYHVNTFLLSAEFSFSDENPSGLPIKVYTGKTLSDAQRLLDTVSSLFLLAILLDAIICTVVYLRKRRMKA